ncbi:MAG: alanine racemase [Bacteroidetes bacterium 4572_77]|nr:MAG: alanine racemase [Bacteroidetes bacterium 4572_77]
MRLTSGKNNCSIIYDDARFSPPSLEKAMDFLIAQRQHIKRSLILSQIEEGYLVESHSFYSALCSLMKLKKIDSFIGIGASFQQYASCFDSSARFYVNEEEFLKEFDFSSLTNQTILIKGNEHFQLLQTYNLLQEYHQQTTIEVDLDALLFNLDYFKQKLKPETKLMLMVKAFSYGSGSFEIANMLCEEKVDYLGVAYTHEGVVLRNAGIELPIMVMNVVEEDFKDIIAHQLEPEIYSLRQLDQFIAFLHKENSSNNICEIHLKLDTGMKRLGFEYQDIPQLISLLKLQKGIRIQSVFSHFSTTDEPEHHADFTHSQAARFQEMAKELKNAFAYPIISHISNSAGISNFPEYQMDMVRLGIGLFGFSPNETDQKALRNLFSFKSRISQIRNIKKGESIGYGRAYIAEEDKRIAIIAAGYADGIYRYMGNGNYKVRIAQQEVPIIARVCMDMCMLDVSKISCQEGDEVVVFDRQADIVNIAELGRTIDYEVITNLSDRPLRVFVKSNND